MKALGLIETKGYLNAIVASDTALKAANVKLLQIKKVRGGLATVQLLGDVGSVKAAVDAGREVVASGKLISAHVIPRIHQETAHLLTTTPDHRVDQVEHEQKLSDTEVEPEVEKTMTTSDTKVDLLPEEAEETTDTTAQDRKVETSYTEETLQKMTVAQLRELVRKLNLMKEDRTKINFAKKNELIQMILEKD